MPVFKLVRSSLIRELGHEMVFQIEEEEKNQPMTLHQVSCAICMLLHRITHPNGRRRPET